MNRKMYVCLSGWCRCVYDGCMNAIHVCLEKKGIKTIELNLNENPV